MFGSVVVVDSMASATTYELIHVDHDNLIGEIIRLKGDFFTIQIYEETIELMMNDPILRITSLC